MMNDSRNILQLVNAFNDNESYILSSDGVILVESNLWLKQLPFKESVFLICTSGSSGEPKWVVHSKVSILEHARLVNDHLEISQKDVIGLMLPVYHVGGLGGVARSIVTEASYAVFIDKWTAVNGVNFIEVNSVSVVSLVPTQLVDIVREAIQCPKSLRLVIIGGGKLDCDTKEKAIRLGWPVYESYGMTETGSQIATGVFENDYMKLIDGWQVCLGDDGLLKVKGECLMKGYFIMGKEGGYIYVDPRVDGWFQTSDQVEVISTEKGTGLKFIGRGDQRVKILGELVDLSLLENGLMDCVNHTVYIVPIRDARRGVKLFPVVLDVEVARLVDSLNWSGLERLEKALVIERFPINEMGKLQRVKLAEKVESIVFPVD